MRAAVLRVLVLLLLFVLAGATDASAQSVECRDPMKRMVVVDLLFGRNIEGRLGVTESRFAQFLAEEITPRFPDGLTVFDTTGQWRHEQRKVITRERSKVVMIAVTEDAGLQPKLDAIVAAYKQRFRQQSVGVMIRPACVSF
jgi:hypothetical protein